MKVALSHQGGRGILHFHRPSRAGLNSSIQKRPQLAVSTLRSAVLVSRRVRELGGWRKRTKTKGGEGEGMSK